MAIEFRCPQCSALLRTPDETAGKVAKCPQCGTLAAIPAASPGPAAMAAAQTDTLPPPSASDNPFGDQAASAAAVGPGTDAANPYASPRLPQPGWFAAAGVGPAELQLTRIQFDEIFSRTWQVFSANLGPCALVGLVMLGILIAYQVVSMVVGFVASASNEPLIVIGFQVANQALAFLVQTWFSLGIAYFGIQLVRSSRAQVNDFFAVGPYYLRGLGMTLLIMLLVFGAILLCLLPALVAFLALGGPHGFQDNPAPTVVVGIIGGLAAIVVATWITLRAYLGLPFIVDRNLGVMEALSSSDKYMSGNKLTMFVVMLIVGIASALFACLTCYIGIILVYPYGGVLIAVAYLTATGQFRTEAKGL